MTKTISSVSTWKAGQTLSATKLFLKCIDDDLSTTAIYHYSLQTNAGAIVADGEAIMTGSAYTSRTDADSVFTWAASLLSLTLT